MIIQKTDYGNSKDGRLEYWKSVLRRDEQAYQPVLDMMDVRDRLKNGARAITEVTTHGGTYLKGKDAKHVRNIVDELIEAQTDSTIPQPKVTAREERWEEQARVVEDDLRNELNRLPFERINDAQERICKVHGSCFYHIDWDESKRKPNRTGEVVVTYLLPKQIIPQEGIVTGIQDMDRIIVKFPQTRENLERKYDVKLDDVKGEEEPEIRSDPDDGEQAEDMLTQYVAYYKNDDGSIGMFSWVRDTVLVDNDDYQARRVKRCKECNDVIDTFVGGEPFCVKCDKVVKVVDKIEEYEELTHDIALSDGRIIPAESIDMMTGKKKQTRLPYYKSGLFPIVEQKNVCDPLQFLGESDVDKIADQQNTMNILCSQINDCIMASGSYIILPPDTKIKTDGTEAFHIRIPATDINAANMIRAVDVKPDVTQDEVWLNQVYQQARDILGITDSFQGKRDTTARSGAAKQFSAAQAAGRLESKRMMKAAAYADIFEMIFKLKLAYCDERRPVFGEDREGRSNYRSFLRYDFLDQDLAGNWFYNDDMLFEADLNSSLSTNRPAMWQENRANFQFGTFGNPADIMSRVIYWDRQEKASYPGADSVKEFMLEQKQAQEEAMRQQQEAIRQKRDAMMQDMQGIAAQKAEEGAEKQANSDAFTQAALDALQEFKRRKSMPQGE